MTNTSDTKPSPIEVWLRQDNMQINCFLAKEDETTEELDIDSLSMRGAQREITGHLIRDGYSPVGRWKVEHEYETVRTFKLA